MYLMRASAPRAVKFKSHDKSDTAKTKTYFFIVKVQMCPTDASDAGCDIAARLRCLCDLGLRLLLTQTRTYI